MSRTYRSWPASDVGWARAGARSSSTSVSPLRPIPGSVAWYASTCAIAESRRGGMSGASSMRTRSGRAAGFSFATRTRSISSSRCGAGRCSTSGNSVATSSSSEATSSGPSAASTAPSVSVIARRRHELRGLRDDEVEDLVEQLQRGQLAGLGAGLAGLPRPVDRGDHASRGGHVRGQARRSGGAPVTRRGVEVEVQAGGPRDRQGAHGRSVAGSRAGARPDLSPAAGARSASTRSIARRRSSKPGRVELVAPLADPLGAVEPASRGPAPWPRARAGRGPPPRRPGRAPRRCRRAPTRSRRRSPRRAGGPRAMFSMPRCEPHTSPTLRARGKSGDLVDEAHVARADEHRDDGHASGHVGLCLVRVERGRRDEVVVVPVESFGELLEQDAHRLDPVGERLGDPLRVDGRVGATCTPRTARGRAARDACARRPR